MKNCDLCNQQISESEMTVIPKLEFQKAVREGFNPFKTSGLDLSIITTSLSLSGISAEQYFPRWRQNALNDSTDWGLCPNCVTVFRSIYPGLQDPQDTNTTGSQTHQPSVNSSQNRPIAIAPDKKQLKQLRRNVKNTYTHYNPFKVSTVGKYSSPNESDEENTLRINRENWEREQQAKEKRKTHQEKKWFQFWK